MLRRGSSDQILGAFRSLSAGDVSPGGHIATHVLEAIETHQSAATNPPPLLLPSATQDGLTCPICLDVLAAPVTLECGHNCCKSCFVSFLEQSVQTKTVCPGSRCEIKRMVPKTNVTLQGLITTKYPERHQSKLDSLPAEDKSPLLDARVETLNNANAQALTGVAQGAPNTSLKSAAASCIMLLLAYAVGSFLEPMKTSYTSTVDKQPTSQPSPPSAFDYIFPPNAPETFEVFDNYQEWITSSDNFNYAWAMHIMPVHGLLLFIRFGNPEWANPLFPGIFTTTAGPLVERDAHVFAESIRAMSIIRFWTTYVFHPRGPLLEAMAHHHAGNTMSWGPWCLSWTWLLEDFVIVGGYISWLLMMKVGIPVSSMMVQAVILMPFEGFCTAVTTGMCGFWISLFKAAYQKNYWQQVLCRVVFWYIVPFGMLMALNAFVTFAAFVVLCAGIFAIVVVLVAQQG